MVRDYYIDNLLSIIISLALLAIGGVQLSDSFNGLFLLPATQCKTLNHK